MSCKHLLWGHYCKKRQEFCQDAFEDHEELCVNCSDYKDKNEVIDLKKLFNKGLATDITCNCSESGYVTLLECLFNQMYPEDNVGLFGHTSKQAEDRVIEDMLHLGWNDHMLKTAFDKTTINNSTTYKNNRAKFDNFVNGLNKIPHKNYEERYPFEYRFVLTLILGYLDKLDSIAIIDCDDPKSYFKDKVSEVRVLNLTDAVNKTRLYVKASNDIKLAEGMRRVEAWFEELAKENIPPKELTIAEIEKQLGYKIKIVGE